MMYLLSEGALLKYLSELRTTGHTCRRILGWDFVRFMQIEFWYVCWGKFCVLYSHYSINTSKYTASKNTLNLNMKGFENERVRVNLIHCCSSCLREVAKPPETSGLSVSLVGTETGHFPNYKIRQHENHFARCIANRVILSVLAHYACFVSVIDMQGPKAQKQCVSLSLTHVLFVGKVTDGYQLKS